MWYVCKYNYVRVCLCNYVGIITSMYCLQTISIVYEIPSWENFGGGKIGKFGKLWAIFQNFPCQYSQIHQKFYLTCICTDCSLFTKLFHTVCQNFIPAIIFPCTVYIIYTYSFLINCNKFQVVHDVTVLLLSIDRSECQQ